MRRGIKTRVLSLFLVFTMVLGFMPATPLGDLMSVTAKAASFDPTAAGFPSDYVPYEQDFSEMGIKVLLYDRRVGLENYTYLVIEPYGTGAHVIKDFASSTAETPWRNSGASEIYIDDGITSIGKFAFANISTLSKVYVGESVTSISEGAFQSNTNLGTVNLSDAVNLESIGNNAFNGCGIGQAPEQKLTTLDLAHCDQLTTIGEGAFNGCRNLESVALYGPATIGVNAFRDTANLTSLTFKHPENLQTIGNNAFYLGSTNRAKVLDLDFTRFTGLQSIGTYAFHYRTLDTVDLSACTGVTAIPNAAFHNCAIKTLKLPPNLATIGSSAFSYNSFTEVTIPSKVTSIGNDAFRYDRSLANINVESTELRSLGELAFGHDSLDAYQKQDTITDADGNSFPVMVGQTIRFDEAVPDSVKDLFISGDGGNCYLGQVDKLRYDHTEPATCTEPAKKVYYTTYTTGSGAQLIKYIYEPQGAPNGHHLVKDTVNSVVADCEHEGFDLMKCNSVNKGVPCDYEERQNQTPALGHDWTSHTIDPTAGKGGYTEIYCTRCDAVKSVTGITSATGYNWVVGSVVNVTATTDGSIPYSSAPFDEPPSSYTVTIPNISLTVPGGTKLSTVALPALPEEEGTLRWKDGDHILTHIGDDPQQITAVFTPAQTTGVSAQASSTWPRADVEFTVDIVVEQGVISFADTRFTPTEVLQSESYSPRTVNDPVGVAPNGGVSHNYKHSMNPGDTFTLSATYTYDNVAYRVDTSAVADGYNVSASDDTITLSASGTVMAKSLEDVTVSAAAVRTYDGTAKPMVTFSPLPSTATVTYTGTDADGNPINLTETLGMYATASDTLTTLNAGTYTITEVVLEADGTDTVTKSGLNLQTIVRPKPLSIPAGKTLTWSGEAQTGVTFDTAAAALAGVLSGQNANVSFSNETGTRVGSYNATLTIGNSNYCWSTGSSSTVVPFSIAQRTVTVPTTGAASVTFDPAPGWSYTGVNTNGYVNTAVNGTTLEVYLDSGKTILLYAVENAVGSAADTYTPKAKLANNGQNVKWADGSTADKTLEDFVILTAVLDTTDLTITNPTVEYDGQDHSSIHVDMPSDWVGATSSYVVYNSWKKDAESKVTEAIDAGEYYVEVTVNRPNYTQVKRDVVLRITKAAAPTAAVKINNQLLTAENSTVFYDGTQYVLTPYLTGVGLVSGETDTDLSAPGSRWTVAVTGLDKGKAAGDYSAVFTLSHPNYESVQVSGAFSIMKNAQNLTPATYNSSADTWTAISTPHTVKYGDAAFTVGAVRSSDSGVGAGTATFESSNTNVATVNSMGLVTIKEVGSTDITIAYPGDDNWDEEQCVLHLTVAKADQTISASTTDPTVTVSGTDISAAFAPEGVIDMTYTASESFGSNNASGARLTFAVADNTVASVADDGKLTIHKVGSTTLTVTAAATEHCAEKVQVFDLTVNPAELDVTVTYYSGAYDGGTHNAVQFVVVKGAGTDAAGIPTDRYTVEYSTDGVNYASDMPTVTQVADTKTVTVKVTVANYNVKTVSGTAEVSRREITAAVDAQAKDYLDGFDPDASAVTYTGIVDAEKTAVEDQLNRNVTFEVWETDSTDDLTAKVDWAYYVVMTADKTYVVKPIYDASLTTALPNYSITPVNGPLTVQRITDPDASIVQSDVDVGASYAPVVMRNGTPVAAGGYTLYYAVKTGESCPANGDPAWQAGKPNGADTYWLRADIAQDGGFQAQTVVTSFIIRARAVDVVFKEGDNIVTQLTTTYTGSPIAADVYEKAVAPGAAITYKFYTDSSCTTLFGTDGNTAPTDADTYYVKATATMPYFTDGTAIAELVIERAPAVISVAGGNSGSAVYGQTVTLNCTVTGGTLTGVTSGNSDYVTATLSGNTVTLKVNKAQSTTDVVITLSATADDSGNYADSNLAYTLSVGRATLKPTFTPYADEYDGAAHLAAARDLKDGSGSAVIDSTVQCYYSDSALAADTYYTAGSQTMPTVKDVTDSGKVVYYYIVDSADNYAPASGSFTVGSITPKAVTVDVTAQSAVYNGTEPSVVQSMWTLHTGSALAGGDTNAALGITLSKAPGVHAKEYALTGSASPANSNYNVTFENAKFTITPAAVSVAIKPGQTAVFTGSAPALSNVKDDSWNVSSGTIYGSDDLGITLIRTAAGATDTTATTVNDADTYRLTATSSNTDYAVTVTDTTFTITPKSITGLTYADIADQTYTGSAILPALTVTDAERSGYALVKDKDYTVKHGTNNTIVGTAASITIEGKGNYTGEMIRPFTITKATVAVTAQNAPKKYGQGYPAFTVSYSGFVGTTDNETNAMASDSALTYTVKDSGGAVKAPADAYTLATGTYTIVPSGLKADNYDFTYTNGTLTVSERAITNAAVTLGHDSLTYNGAAQADTVTVTDTLENSAPVMLVEGTDYTLSYTKSDESTASTDKPVAAGTYTVTVTGKGNYSGSIANAGYFTIGRMTEVASLNVTLKENGTAVTSTTYTYDGTKKMPAVEVLDPALPGEKTLQSGCDYTVTGVDDNINARTYTVTLTFQGNYYGTRTVDYTINQRPLDDSALTWTLLEGGSPVTSATYIYSGDEKKPAVTVAYATNPDAKPVQDTDFTVSYSNNIDVGSSAAVIIRPKTDTGNFKGEKTLNFAINRADLSLTFVDSIILKSNTAPTFTNPLTWRNASTNTSLAEKPSDVVVEYTSSDTQVATVDSTGLISIVGVGNVTITAKVQNADNFKTGASNHFTLIVQASPDKVIPVSASGWKGPYDGNPHTITVDVDLPSYDILYGTSPSATGTGYVADKPTYTLPGIYNVYFMVKNNQYNPTLGYATVEITKAPAELSFAEDTVAATYGDAAITKDVTNPNNLTVSYTTSDPAVAAVTSDGEVTIKGAGNAVITASTTGSAGYEAGSASYTLNVAKKTLTDVMVADITGSYTYDGSQQRPAVTVTGLIADRDYTVAYGTNIAAGTGSVTVTGTGNYTSSVEKSFTIGKATLATLTLSAGQASYTGQEINAAVNSVTATSGDNTLTGLVQGRDYTLSYTGSGLGSTGKPQAVGNYTVTATGTGNYQETATASFEVKGNANLLTLTLTEDGSPVTDDTYTYNGSAKIPTVEASINGSALTEGTYTVTYGNNTNAGTATVTVEVTGQGISASKTFRIKQKTLALSDLGLTTDTLADVLTYDGLAKNPTSVDFAAKLGTGNYDLFWANESSTNAGDYTIAVSGKANYCGSLTLTYTIAPASLTGIVVGSYDAAPSYTGSAITPDPAVTLSGKTLIRNVDYTLTYKAGDTEVPPKNVGQTYTLVFDGINNYTGSNTTNTFTIQPIVPNLNFTLAQVTQQLTADSTYTGNPLHKPADLSSVTYTSSNTAVATVTLDGTVTMVGTGTTVITATAAAQGNYQAGNASYTLTLTGIEYTAAGFTGTYDGAAHNGTVNVTAPASYTVKYDYTADDGTTKSGESTVPAFTKAGDHTVNYTITADGCETKRGSYTVSIAPKTLTDAMVTGVDSTYTYTGDEPIQPVPTVADGSILTTNDYFVTYGANTAVGPGTVKITGQGNYTGTVRKDFVISAAAVGTGNLTLMLTKDGNLVTTATYTYNGSAQKPTVTVTYTAADSSSRTLTTEDYTLVWSNADSTAAGTYTVHAVGKGSYSGESALYSYTINPCNLSAYNVGGLSASYQYTGSAIQPAVTVSSGAKTLAQGADYTVAYGANMDVGTAAGTVTITGTGNYTGTINKTFDITRNTSSQQQARFAFATVTLPYAKNQTYSIPTQNPLTCNSKGTVIYTSGNSSVATVAADGTIAVVGTGTTVILANVAEDAQYAAESAMFTLTVTPKALTDSLVRLSVTSFPYDGSNVTVTPLVSAMDAANNPVTLTKDVDYTLTYVGGQQSAQGTYSVTIEGQGNYSGSFTRTYTITAATLTDDDVAGIAAQTYTGSAIQPAVTVTFHGVTLVKDTDYTVTYGENNTVGTGMGIVTIVGMGNYTTGTTPIVKTFDILAKPNAGLTVSIDDQTYTGDPLKPAVTITDSNRGVTLEKGTDYDVTYTNNTVAGKATATITYKGSYSGTETKDFTIAPAAMSGTVTLSSDPYQYTGSAIQPAVTVSSGAKTLAQGVDYTVAYTDNTAAGTATVTVTGKGNYTGTLTKTFTVAPAELDASAVADISAQLYTGSAVTPDVVVSFNGRTLTKDVDYTVTYGENKNVGTDAGTVTIKGMGNYTTGTTPIVKTFTISAGAPEAIVLTLSAIQLVYNGEPQAPTVTAVTYGGNDLTSADYDVSAPTDAKNVGSYSVTVTAKNGYTGTATATYTITPATLTGTVTAPNQTYTGSALTPAVTVGSLVQGKDYTAAFSGNTNAGSATVTVTGTGNYTGTLQGSFTILPSTLTASSVPSIPQQLYTGSAITPSVAVTHNGRLLTETVDYTVDYTNNTAVGTAFVTVTGKGNYAGTVTKRFTIAAAAVGALNAQLEQTAFTYTGRDIVPTVINVTHSGAPLDAANYDVTVSASVDAGSYTVTVTGKNGYTGSVTLTYTIAPAALTGTVSIPGTFTYTGSAIEPTMVLVDGLTQGTDYTVTCTDNTDVGTATVTLTGTGNYTGTLTDSFDIAAKDINQLQAAAIATQYDNGNAVTPPVYLSMNGRLLTQGTDFTVTYADNDKVGTATVTVTGQGNFTGTRELTFEIEEKQTVVMGGGGGTTTVVVGGAAEDEGIVINVTGTQIKEADGKVIIHAEDVPTNVNFKVISDGPAKLDVAITETTPGTVVAEVRPDGTLAIVKNAVLTENGVLLNVNGTKDYRVHDNSKWFIDEPIDRWSYESVAFVTARELFNGTTVSTFSPSMNMTRNMLMTVLARLDDADTTISPYEQGMAWAVANGVSDGTNGNVQITREQLVTMLYRYAKLKGYDTTIHTDLSAFADQGSVGAFAREALTWAVEKGIMNGTSATTLSPKANATREQVAAFLTRFCYAQF